MSAVLTLYVRVRLYECGFNIIYMRVRLYECGFNIIYVRVRF